MKTIIVKKGIKNTILETHIGFLTCDFDNSQKSKS